MFMNQNPQVQSGPYTYGIDQEAKDQALHQILSRVFLYMGLGLLLSFASAAVLAYTGLGLRFLLGFGTISMVLVCIVQMALVFGLSAMLAKQRVQQAKLLFVIYSLFTGLTLGLFFTIFSVQSILLALVATAVVFGLMAVWGLRTERDLSSLGTVGRMLLLGCIVVSLLNLILYFVAPGFASALDMVLNYVVLAVFIGLTAYDMNRIKQYSEAALMNGASAQLVDSLAVSGALSLYLDFINIFIRLLTIFGRNRD